MAENETVLVIDDDDASPRRRPSIAGFDTLEARDGSEAIHIFAEHSQKITAVTLDLENAHDQRPRHARHAFEYAPRLLDHHRDGVSDAE